MNRSRLILWVIAAVAAIGVTTAAVTVANASGGRDDVLSQDEVSRQLADQTGSPPATADPASPAPSGAGDSVTMRSEAAQVVARCDGSTTYLEAWSPNPGYRVDEVVRGPAPEAVLWIESDTFEDVELRIRCEAATPVLTDLVEPDDHGGDRDDDRRDGDRSGD